MYWFLHLSFIGIMSVYNYIQIIAWTKSLTLFKICNNHAMTFPWQMPHCICSKLMEDKYIAKINAVLFITLKNTSLQLILPLVLFMTLFTINRIHNHEVKKLECKYYGSLKHLSEIIFFLRREMLLLLISLLRSTLKITITFYEFNKLKQHLWSCYFFFLLTQYKVLNFTMDLNTYYFDSHRR